MSLKSRRNEYDLQDLMNKIIGLNYCMFYFPSTVKPNSCISEKKRGLLVTRVCYVSLLKGRYYRKTWKYNNRKEEGKIQNHSQNAFVTLISTKEPILASLVRP